MMKSTGASPLGQRSGQRGQIEDSQHVLQVNNFPCRFRISSHMDCDGLGLCPTQDTAVASVQPQCSGQQFLSFRHRAFFKIKGPEVASPQNLPVLESFSAWPGDGKPMPGCFDVKTRSRPSSAILLSHCRYERL